jgi:hypothetical protein
MDISNRVKASLGLVFVWLIATQSVQGQTGSHGHQGSSEILAFVSADYARIFDEENMSVDDSRFTPALDLLYSKSIRRWRFLAEYLLTNKESELERLQLGYDASQESTIWFGRFHQPTSAWIAKYHHGRFLQTSISRPAIEEWEDDGGVIPAHISGFMLEQGIPLEAGRGSRISMAFGAGPEIKNGELVTFDILDPKSGVHRLSAGISFAYYPDYLAGTNFGISGAHAQITVRENPALGLFESFVINQTTISAQIDWRKEDWQFLGAAYYVNSVAEDSFTQFGDWFVSGYAELQRSFKETGTYFGRLEFSRNAKTAGYLTLFPDYSTRKIVAGYRFEFRESQALSIELSDERWLSGSYKQIRIQWSSVFP